MFTEKIDSTKNRILRVEIRRLSTLKLKLSFLGSVTPSEPKNFRFRTSSEGDQPKWNPSSSSSSRSSSTSDFLPNHK